MSSVSDAILERAIEERRRAIEERDAALAEIARLRAALSEIANTPWLDVRSARGAARDALEEKP